MKKVTLLTVGIVMVFMTSIAAYAATAAPKAATQPTTQTAAPTAPSAVSTTPAYPAATTAPAATPTKAAAPAAKKEKPKGVEAVVDGKIETKAAKNKKGKEVTHCLIVVSSAQGADGKAIDALKGKTLRVVGKKVEEVKKHVGKTVKLSGEVFENKRLRVDSIK
jgi:glucose/arabinose dehydrogenase